MMLWWVQNGEDDKPGWSLALPLFRQSLVHVDRAKLDHCDIERRLAHSRAGLWGAVEVQVFKWRIVQGNVGILRNYSSHTAAIKQVPWALD